MTHENRYRLDVNPSGNWRLYTNTLPVGWEAKGTVTREGFDTGALFCIPATGEYVQMNAGVCRSLDQRKIKAALGLTV
jgi:hypothetical protein